MEKLTNFQYFIATDDYKTDDLKGNPVEVSIGNQFIFLEDLKDGHFRLKFIDSDDSSTGEVVLPSSILEDMSNDSPMKQTPILRSQSSIKERTCSLNINYKDSEVTLKSRFSTFGHGSDGMSRSIYDTNRNRTMPSAIKIKEISDKDITKMDDNIENNTVMRNSLIDNKWKKINENDIEIYVNVDTGEKWHSTIDQSGRQYFYNEASRLSTWKLPGEHMQVETSLEDEPIRPNEETLECVDESSESDISWQEESSDEGNKEKIILAPSPVSAPATSMTFLDKEDSGSRFNIRHIKKEHISGPLFNKIMRTERSGTVEKTKISENGKEVQKKWSNFHIVLTGPELLFYKDIKAVTAKPGMPQGKVDLKLKIQNLQFLEKTESNFKGCVLQVEDTGAPGSNITYLLRFSSTDEMKGWKVALQLSKDWQYENLYSESKFNTESGTVEDTSGDRQNIGIKLKQFLKKRPTRESLELRGILKPESVFGSSLDILCDQEKSKVPEFVFRCILAIEARGLHHNGLYRISGNQAKIQKLRLAVDENKYQLNSESMELETLTGAFKSFFKELKEPLFDEEFCSKMVDILSNRKGEKKNPYRDVNFSSAKKFISKMKPSHYETAKALIGHLHKVAALSSKNLMDVSNLSMVWGPNLYASTGQASTKLAVILMTHNQIIDFLISHYPELFDKA